MMMMMKRQLSRHNRSPMLTVIVIHNLHTGYVAIGKQLQVNKFSLPYDSIPHQVLSTEGLMVWANQITGAKCLTRNSSHSSQCGVKRQRCKRR